MAKAIAIHKSAFPDVVLELNPEEARALVEYLSIHSIVSSINTYPIFRALSEALDDYPSAKQSVELSQRTTLENGLVRVHAED